MLHRPASLPTPPIHAQKRKGRWSLKAANHDSGRNDGKYSCCARTVLGAIEPNQIVSEADMSGQSTCSKTVAITTARAIAADSTAQPQKQRQRQRQRRRKTQARRPAQPRARLRARAEMNSQGPGRLYSASASMPWAQQRSYLTVRMQLQGQIICIRCHRDMPMSWVVSECVRCYARRRGLCAGEEPFAVVRLTKQVSIQTTDMNYVAQPCSFPPGNSPSSAQTDHKGGRLRRFVRWISRGSNSHADGKARFEQPRVQVTAPAAALPCPPQLAKFRVAINLSEPIGVCLSDNELVTVVTVPAK